jgi:hypothetical protein
MDPVKNSALGSGIPVDPLMPPKERVWQNIQMVCGLFDMARSIKTLQLRRQHPDASQEWIDQEVLALIERGCA